MVEPIFSHLTGYNKTGDGLLLRQTVKDSGRTIQEIFLAF